MKIGIVKEIKAGEGRVALLPEAVETLVDAGHQVMVEYDAGKAAGHSNEDYEEAGATVQRDTSTVWESDFVVKVKEPLTDEFQYLRPDLKLLSYLHLAAEPELHMALVSNGVVFTALEDIEMNNRHAALDPMSIVAGRVAVNLALSSLFYGNEGSGILLGGVLGTRTGTGVIVGGGVSGMAAAEEMLKHSMDVIVYDINPEVIAKINQRGAKMNRMGGNIIGKMSTPGCIASALEVADVVIGAVLVPGTRAPIVVTEDMIAGMKKGSVIVDIAIDQGGCVEGIDYTTWNYPSYNLDGINFIAIPNLPGAVPQTSSIALSGVVLPLVVEMAKNKRG